MNARQGILAMAMAIATLFVPHAACADVPAPELMAKLAEHAAAFEQMRNHASFSIAAHLDELDGDGAVTSTKSGTARVEADGNATHVIVRNYVEDGKDKTGDAQKEQREYDRKRARRSDDELLHMPFLERERGKYVFDEVEHDPANPARVRISFVPRQATTHSLEGSAWVDTSTGRVVSAGFKMSRTPMFVDFIHVTVEFAAQTTLGPAVSKVTFDGGGGIWFFHKHFVGNATLSDYRITP